MTLHIAYGHQCDGCGAYYIPYDQVPCPRCGLIEEERFDYIPQAIASLRFNKEGCGTYTPPAWWVGTLGDHILRLLFGVFDSFEGEADSRDFEEFLADRLAQMDWGDQPYLRDHVRDIAVRIHLEL